LPFILDVLKHLLLDKIWVEIRMGR